MRLIVEKEEVAYRLDTYIKLKTSYSRTYAESLIDDGFVSVNDNYEIKNSYKVKDKDIIVIDDVPEKELDISAENIPINILYEDQDILIVNKDRGMVVHPSNGHESGTLVNAVMFHCKDKLSTINGIIRPGIVHRIDKDTSGILCVCKNDNAHKNIAEQFYEHSNIRKYRAIVKGNVKNDEGYIDKPITRDKKNRLRMACDNNGKPARTHYKVLERFADYTYIECELYTGRTHQIRVHMASIGYPLLGDLLYGRQDKKFKDLDGQILHAYYLELTHPNTKERMKFETDNPKYFDDIIYKLRYV